MAGRRPRASALRAPRKGRARLPRSRISHLVDLQLALDVSVWRSVQAGPRQRAGRRGGRTDGWRALRTLLLLDRGLVDVERTCALGDGLVSRWVGRSHVCFEVLLDARGWCGGGGSWSGGRRAGDGGRRPDGVPVDVMADRGDQRRASSPSTRRDLSAPARALSRGARLLQGDAGRLLVYRLAPVTRRDGVRRLS